MVEIFIELLGSLLVRVGEDDGRPKGRKACALLGVVALAPGRTAPRERLAELLWSDRGEEQARGSLRQALAELRATLLGTVGAIAIGRDRVALVERLVTTDIAEIMDACETGDIRRLADRMAAVGGILLAGLDGLSPAFDDWLRVERARQHECIVGAVLHRAKIMLNEGRSTDLPTILRGLDVLDPANEIVARLGMQADHLAGDLASLHRRYRRLTDDLQREFGARPSKETRTLFYRLTAVDAPRPKASAATEQASGEETPPRTPPIVVVSPITASGGGPEAQEIAAIASEDIRVALGRHSEVRVAMLDGLDIERVEQVCGNALAAYMLSGRLRDVQGETRVVLQLGNISSRIVVWSEQIQVDQTALAITADRIVTRAVGAVLPSIDRDLGTQLRQRRPGQDDAVALYARGRHLIRSVRTLEAVRSGMALLENAIALDPAHIGARLLLAQLYNTDLWQQVIGHDVDGFRAKALTLVQEAAAIEPGNARIQMKLAWCHLRRRDWSSCERRLTAALESSPYDADAVNEAALAVLQLGDLDRAEDLMQRSFALNPFPPADYHADFALLRAMRDDPVGAEEHFEASGETRLQYLAMRLANLSEHRGSDQRKRTLAEEFRTRFAAGWSVDRPPDIEDMLQWLDQTYVFRLPEHQLFWRDRFKAGLE